VIRDLGAALRQVRSSGRSGSVRRPAIERPEREDLWALFSVALATLIIVVDGVGGNQFVFAGFLVLPPIIASTTTSVRATILVAGYCVALGLMSVFWHGDLALWRTFLREILIALAALLSVWNAVRREALVASARGGAMLASGLTPLDNALEESGVGDDVVKMAVPDLAELAIVDLVGSDGSIGAVAVKAADPAITRKITSARRTRRIDRGASQAMAEVIASGEQRHYTHMTDVAMREIAIDDGHLKIIRDVRPRSTLIVPLQARGRTIGTLTLVSLENDDRYGKGEVAMAEEIAARAATALVNARLHDEQAHLARALQRALIPGALPKIEGVEVAASFRPVAGEIGGDFYDIFQIGPDKWKAVIGDACGKGPEAAALTSVMRDTLRAAALRGDTPSGTLQLLNAAIRDAGEGRFCTASCVRLEAGSAPRLVVCNGGHPPPLVLRSDGTVEAIGPSGTLLGVYDDIDLIDTSVALKKGDLAMLFTDGLFDVSSKPANGETIGAMLARCKGKSAEETVAAIEAAVIERQSGEPQDDIAILAMRLT
jgi:serine phosphatase RsbU (regulator of sigma subunit)